MNSQTAIDILAGRLGTDAAEAERLLDALTGSMIAELLDKGSLVVEGLGSFSIVHDHAVREHSEKGELFMPPKNRILYQSSTHGRGDTARLASERMAMDGRRAQEFAAAMRVCFSRRKTDSSDITVRGFGSFSKVDGVYGFRPEQSLDDLVNNAYDGLGAIVMPAVQGDGRGVRGNGQQAWNGGLRRNVIRIAGAAGAVVMVSIAGVALYRTGRPLPPDNTVQGARVSVVRSSPPKALPVVEPAKEAFPKVARVQKRSSADSVVLGKERFTVIVATYRNLVVARQEVHQLSQDGQRFWIWPVSSNGERFYRVVSGDYSSYPLAKKRMNAMPDSQTESAYIQKASKNVMLYGEKGL